MSKKNKLDQYYTQPEIATECLNILIEFLGSKDYNFVEPSAGTGNFLRPDLKWEAYDLEPKVSNITKKDFLTVENLTGKVVVGNPPFGFASSLALKFINHSFEEGAEVVAFILPKTFKKVLFMEKVTHQASLALQKDLPKNSFILNGEDYDVPCVFQVWVKFPRAVINYNKYLTKGSEKDYDFMLRRVGGRAGRLITKEEFTKSSSLYVKGDKTYIEKYQDRIREEASFTAGVKSITIDEINYIITKGEMSC